MIKTMTCVAALTALTAVPAFAQMGQPAQPAQPPARTETMKPTTEVPGPWLGTQVWKQGVYDAQENRIGEVDNLVIDPDGKISEVLVGVGGFLGLGEKTVAIPFASLKQVKRDGRMWFTTAMTKEQLTNAAVYDTRRFNVN